MLLGGSQLLDLSENDAVVVDVKHELLQRSESAGFAARRAAAQERSGRRA